MTEKESALKVYVMWSWIEQQLGTGKSAKKPDYPLYYELNFDLLCANCPWCEMFISIYETAGECTPDGSPDCPLVKIGQCCDSIQLKDEERVWWKIYKSSNLEVSCITKSVAAGNIAAVAWKEYKKLGG